MYPRKSVVIYSLLNTDSAGNKSFGPFFYPQTINSHRYVYTHSDTTFKHVPNYEKTLFLSKTVQLFDAANKFVRCVGNVFGDGILISGLWPPRSLDLHPCDFWWSGLRSLQHSPSTLFMVRYFTLPTAAGTSLNIVAILPLVLPFLDLLQHLQVGVPHIFLSVSNCPTRTH